MSKKKNKWTTQDGRTINIDSMHTKHIENAAKKLEREFIRYFAELSSKMVSYNNLKDELQKRGE